MNTRRMSRQKGNDNRFFCFAWFPILNSSLSPGITCSNFSLKNNQLAKSGCGTNYINETCTIECSHEYRFHGTEQEKYVTCQLSNDRQTASWEPSNIADCESKLLSNLRFWKMYKPLRNSIKFL